MLAFLRENSRLHTLWQYAWLFHTSKLKKTIATNRWP